MVAIRDFEMPNTCSDCPYCIHTADEKRYIGYCNTSDNDYYCKALHRFMEYDKVDDGIDILGKPSDCPLVETILKADCEDRLKADKVVILDKLRAEIEQITDTMGVSYNQYVSKIDVLAILDKYKAESEDKE